MFRLQVDFLFFFNKRGGQRCSNPVVSEGMPDPQIMSALVKCEMHLSRITTKCSRDKELTWFERDIQYHFLKDQITLASRQMWKIAIFFKKEVIMYLTADQFTTVQRINRRELGKGEKLQLGYACSFLCLSHSDLHFILLFIPNLLLCTVLLPYFNRINSL